MATTTSLRLKCHQCWAFDNFSSEKYLHEKNWKRFREMSPTKTFNFLPVCTHILFVWHSQTELRYEKVVRTTCMFVNKLGKIGQGSVRVGIEGHFWEPVSSDRLMTREMRGIVRQALGLKAWWPAKCVLWEVDRTLVHEIWWRKIEKIKGDRRATMRYVVFFFLREYTSPRTSSTVVWVLVVGVCEVRTLAGMPGLLIVLDLDTACACQWERRWRLKKRLNLKG